MLIESLLGLASSPYESSTVCPSVRPSVCNKSSHTSHHQYFLLLCIKLAFNKSRKVTFSDFRKKNVLAPKWTKQAQIGPNWPKNRIFLSFLKFTTLDFAYFAYSSSVPLCLTAGLTKRLEKNVKAQNLGLTVPKRSQNGPKT